MNKVKLLVIVSSGLLLANIVLLILFFGNGMPHDMQRFREPKQVIAERLRLDAEQFQEFEKLVQTHREEIRKCDRELNDAKWALMSILIDSSQKGNPDSLTNAIGKLQIEAEKIRFQHFLGIKKICRDDQLGAYNEIIKDLPRIMRGPGHESERMPPDLEPINGGQPERP